MKKIILDLDTGIDDTLAMSYVLASEDAELIGITGTYGNVLLETGVANDLNLLSMFGREDIPVFKGVPIQATPPISKSPAAPASSTERTAPETSTFPLARRAKSKKRLLWISLSTAHANTVKTNSCTFPPARPPISTRPSPKPRTSLTTSPS